VPCEVGGNYSSGWTVRWTPRQLGVHSVDVDYGHSCTLPASPFTCRVFDLSKVIILRDQRPTHDDVTDDDVTDDVIFYGTLNWVDRFIVKMLEENNNFVRCIMIDFVQRHLTLLIMLYLRIKSSVIMFCLQLLTGYLLFRLIEVKFDSIV